MFTISQFGSKLKSINLTITVICLLIFLSTSVIPVGLAISGSIVENIKEATPYDSTIIRRNTDEMYSKQLNQNSNLKSIKDEFIDKGVNLSILVKNSSEIKVYRFKDLTINDIGLYYSIDGKNRNNFVEVVSINDYNVARKQQGLNEIQLREDEFELNSNNETVRNIYEKNIKSSDKVVNNFIPVENYLNCNYIKANNEYDNKLLNEFFKLNRDNYRFESKLVIDGEKLSMNISLSYISLYFAISLREAKNSLK